MVGKFENQLKFLLNKHKSFIEQPAAKPAFGGLLVGSHRFAALEHRSASQSPILVNDCPCWTFQNVSEVSRNFQKVTVDRVYGVRSQSGRGLKANQRNAYCFIIVLDVETFIKNPDILWEILPLSMEIWKINWRAHPHNFTYTCSLSYII